MRKNAAEVTSNAADHVSLRSEFNAEPATSLVSFNNVWRLFPSDADYPAIDSRLEPLIELVTASRSRVIARLVTLRLMSGRHPLRENFTAMTVVVGQKAFLAEEELIETMLNELGMPSNSGSIYCSLQMRLEYLGRLKVPASYRAGSGSSWEHFHSEILHSVNDCAAYVMSVLSQVSGDLLDVDKLRQRYCDALQMPLEEQLAI